MNSTPDMENLIRNLGCSYDALVHNKVIDKLPLESLYEDGQTLEVEPVDGLQLVFWPDAIRQESSRFELIFITVKVDGGGAPVYTGMIPSPYGSLKNRDTVNQTLGRPITSRSTLELIGTGLTGWDTYQVESRFHPTALVDFQYIENNAVGHIQFSVMDKHV